MKAMREIGHQDVPWVHTQWGSREVDVRARDELLARLFKEISTGKTSAVVLAATNSFVCAARCGQARSHASPWWPSALMGSFALGANVLKLRAILGALALSFFGMRFWVFIGIRLSPDFPAKARGLPSLSREDRASKDYRVQESVSVTSL